MAPHGALLLALALLLLFVAEPSCAQGVGAKRAVPAGPSGVDGGQGSLRSIENGRCSSGGLLPFHHRLSDRLAVGHSPRLCPTTRAHAATGDRALTSSSGQVEGFKATLRSLQHGPEIHSDSSSSSSSKNNNARKLLQRGREGDTDTGKGKGTGTGSQLRGLALTSARHITARASTIPTVTSDQQDSESTAGGHAPGFVGVAVGWLAQDNMGDDIVADLFLDLFVAALIQVSDPSTCISVERASRELASAGWRNCTMSAGRGCDFAVMGGGSTVSVDYIKRIEAVLRAKRPVLLFGSGYQSGLRPPPEHRKTKFFELLCRSWLSGGVRGPHTKAQLVRYGCSQDLGIIRDAGFLADPLYSNHHLGSATTSSDRSGTVITGGHAKLVEQLRQHLGAGRKVLAVTLKQEFVEVLNRTLLQLLATQQFAVVLQAVDNTTLALHRQYQARVNRMLPPGAPPVLVSEETKDWAAILDVYHHVNVSLNSRLHSGVLSASALRPTLYVATNTKFVDFGASLGAGRREPSVDVRAGLGPEPEQDLVRSVLLAVNMSSTAKQRLAALQRDTLLSYHAAMTSFMAQLEQRDPRRFQAMLCCDHLKVVRSTPFDKRQLIMVQCTQPRGQQAHQASSQ